MIIWLIVIVGIQQLEVDLLTDYMFYDFNQTNASLNRDSNITDMVYQNIENINTLANIVAK